MKKHLHNSLRALFMSLALLLSLPMLAVEIEIDGINYDLNAEAKQATVIAKSSGKYSGKVVIPESVEFKGVAHSVTSIGGSAFENCYGLTSVTIPNSVTSIGKWAFGSCSGLTSVTIPNSVTSIGIYAFSSCEGLTSVHISDIAAWCNIDFGDNPLYYAHHLYLNGEEVKDLVIPNSVTSIGDYTFEGCSGLTSVTIPNSVTSIGDRAFYKCSGLTSVTIPNSVTSIGGEAFWRCKGLTSVTIGNSVTSIGDAAFYGCKCLTSVTIPNSVTSIGEEAFHYCSGLTSVTIGNSVTSIGSRAFQSCSGLTSVTIGNSVKSIESYAFANCPELLDVYCYAEKVPSTYSNAFNDSYPEYVTLHVPDASINSYKATSPWSSFGKIVALTDEETGSTENTNPYEAMAGKWTMTTANGSKWNVTVIAAAENDPDYNKVLYVTGMMGYDWTVLTMNYSYNYEEGKPEVYIKAGELFAEGVNFAGLGVCNVYLYNIDGSNLVPNDMVAEVSSDGNTLDFGANSFYGAVFTSSNEFAGGWFNETGVKMTRVLPDDETGIDELKSEIGAVKKENSAVYDLSGRRVQKAQKGIFIQNGKVMVR